MSRGEHIRAARQVRRVVKVGDQLVDEEEFRELVESLRAKGYISVSLEPNRRERKRRGEKRAGPVEPRVLVDPAQHPGGEAERRRRRNRRKRRRRERARR